MKLRCYCCGAEIGDNFFLASPVDHGTEVDRVFIMSLRCAQRALDSSLILVERTKTKRQRTKKK